MYPKAGEDCADCSTPGKISKKLPVYGVLAVSASSSGSVNVASCSLTASFGSKVKLNPLSPPLSACNIRSKSGNGLWLIVTVDDSRLALMSSTSACACVDIWYELCEGWTDTWGEEVLEEGKREGWGSPGGGVKPGGTAGTPGGTVGAFVGGSFVTMTASGENGGDTT